MLTNVGGHARVSLNGEIRREPRRRCGEEIMAGEDAEGEKTRRRQTQRWPWPTPLVAPSSERILARFGWPVFPNRSS